MYFFQSKWIGIFFPYRDNDRETLMYSKSYDQIQDQYHRKPPFKDMAVDSRTQTVIVSTNGMLIEMLIHEGRNSATKWYMYNDGNFMYYLKSTYFT